MSVARRCFRLVRSALVSAIVLAIVLTAVYFIFCDRISGLTALKIGDDTVIIGKVTVSQPVEGDFKAVYRVVDPSGDVYVLSQNGPPDVGSYIVCYGSTSETPDRTVFIEGKRFSSF